MDITGSSTSLSTNSLASSSSMRAELLNSESTQDTREARHEHDHGHDHHGKRNGLALGAFRQELRLSLKMHFRADLAITPRGYASQQDAATPDDVAEEALGAARQLVAGEPATAAKSLISFRAKVQETASYVRDTVGEQDDIDEVDDTVARIDGGLAKISDEVATNRESSAAVLEVDMRSKQRSTIQIRTQEGDIVKLSLRSVNRMAATDAGYADAETTLGSTEISVSNNSRMKLKVEGDLNDAELTAIRNVFAQAEVIADEFFGGDIGAAFDSARGFDFDSGQLSRVNMQFRMRQVSRVSYTETATAAATSPAPAPDAGQVAPTPNAARVDTTASTRISGTVTSPEPAATPGTEPAIVADGGSAAGAAVTQNPAEATSISAAALTDFFGQLNAFLRTVGEGFADASYNYHYSSSFKLSLLKAVIHTVAPGDAGNAAETAGEAIDQISEGTEIEND